MRDLVLAKKYKNSNITFATQNLEGNINQKIIDSGYKIYTLTSNKINELIKLIKKLSIDLLVLDIYSLNHNDELKIKKETNVSILSFDDIYKKHYCDILLNHNIYAKKSKYKNLVPKNCELRCGEQYTLLRDEFKKEKNHRVMVAIGGADVKNINIKIIKTLNKYKNVFIDLITTDANKNLAELKAFTYNRNNIKLHINSSQIAKLAKKSSFSVITPSVLANELYSINVPFVSIQTAKNQKYMFEYLKNKNYKTLKRFNSKKLSRYIHEYIT